MYGAEHKVLLWLAVSDVDVCKLEFRMATQQAIQTLYAAFRSRAFCAPGTSLCSEATSAVASVPGKAKGKGKGGGEQFALCIFSAFHGAFQCIDDPRGVRASTPLLPCQSWTARGGLEDPGKGKGKGKGKSTHRHGTLATTQPLPPKLPKTPTPGM